jgi:hypothetical protein
MGREDPAAIVPSLPVLRFRTFMRSVGAGINFPCPAMFESEQAICATRPNANVDGAILVPVVRASD